MFLENCKECNKKVSTSSKFCPKCGVPAPTSKYSRQHPKCIFEDCYEYAETGGKKYKGQCARHYANDIDKSSVIFLLIIFMVGVAIVAIF